MPVGPLKCFVCVEEATIRCGVCKMLYCSVLCRDDHWTAHREVCVPPPPFEKLPGLSANRIGLKRPPQGFEGQQSLKMPGKNAGNLTSSGQFSSAIAPHEYNQEQFDKPGLVVRYRSSDTDADSEWALRLGLIGLTVKPEEIRAKPEENYANPALESTSRSSCSSSSSCETVRFLALDTAAKNSEPSFHGPSYSLPSDRNPDIDLDAFMIGDKLLVKGLGAAQNRVVVLPEDSTKVTEIQEQLAGCTFSPLNTNPEPGMLVVCHSSKDQLYHRAVIMDRVADEQDLFHVRFVDRGDEGVEPSGNFLMVPDQLRQTKVAFCAKEIILADVEGGPWTDEAQKKDVEAKVRSYYDLIYTVTSMDENHGKTLTIHRCLINFNSIFGSFL